MKDVELKSAELCFDRSSAAYVGAAPDVCANCGSVAAVLNVDTSDGEYGWVQYCQVCINAAFAASQETTKENPA